MSRFQMASLALLLSGVLLAWPVSAQQDQFHYQGRLTDAANNPVSSPVSVTFTFYDAENGGGILPSPGKAYSETDTVDPDQFGIFSTIIGDNPSTETGLFDVFLSDIVWLNIEIDGQELSPRRRIVASPFAIRAFTADVAEEADHAQTAGSAEMATNAQNAVNAENAESAQSAQNAVVAQSAEVAQSAQTAAQANFATTAGNANALGGQPPTAYAASSHAHAASEIVSGTISDARISSTITRDSEVMSIVLSNDGYESGLDADTWRGVDHDWFLRSSGQNTLQGSLSISLSNAAVIPLDIVQSANGAGVQALRLRNTGTGNFMNTAAEIEANATAGIALKLDAKGESGTALIATANTLGTGVNVAAKFEAGGQNSTGVRSAGGTYDFYADGAGTNYAPFTGAHEVRLAADYPAEVVPGLIVCATGRTAQRMDAHGAVSLSSTMPEVRLADRAADPAVFGVVVGESALFPGHWYAAGPEDRFAMVNALGEGRVWVCTANGEVNLGDYITTSAVPGYGQRQDDDLLRNSTLGKVIEQVDWSDVGETVVLDGVAYKAYLIALVYVSG